MSCFNFLPLYWTTLLLGWTASFFLRINHKSAFIGRRYWNDFSSTEKTKISFTGGGAHQHTGEAAPSPNFHSFYSSYSLWIMNVGGANNLMLSCFEREM